MKSFKISLFLTFAALCLGYSQAEATNWFGKKTEVAEGKKELAETKEETSREIAEAQKDLESAKEEASATEQGAEGLRSDLANASTS